MTNSKIAFFFPHYYAFTMSIIRTSPNYPAGVKLATKYEYNEINESMNP